MKVAATTANQQNQSRAVANHVSKQKNNSRDDSRFVDNRPETNALKSLQMMINNSPRMAAQRQRTSNITGGKAQVIKGPDTNVPNDPAVSLKFTRLSAPSQLYNSDQPPQIKGIINKVIQRTEIDAIKYINAQGLWEGRPRNGNWIIRLLGELWFNDQFGEYNKLYNILIKNLPERPLEGREGYDPPTVFEVQSALKEEIGRLRSIKIRRNFDASVTEGFGINHVRHNKSSAVERCRARLRGTSTSNNTVLILTDSEMETTLNTLSRARYENWGWIYLYCNEAIQAGMGGIKRLLNVKVKISLDRDWKLAHLHGEDLSYQDSDDQIYA